MKRDTIHSYGQTRAERQKGIANEGCVDIKADSRSYYTKEESTCVRVVISRKRNRQTYCSPLTLKLAVLE